jgi:hypothetical protein
VWYENVASLAAHSRSLLLLLPSLALKKSLMFAEAVALIALLCLTLNTHFRLPLLNDETKNE